MRRWVTLATLVLIVSAAPAASDIRRIPLKIRLVPAGDLQPGQPVVGDLEFTAGASGSLGNIVVRGPGWQTRIDGVTSARLIRGQQHRVTLHATPGLRPGTLEITCEFNGERFERTLDLSASALARTRTGRVVPAPPTPGRLVPLPGPSQQVRPRVQRAARYEHPAVQVDDRLRKDRVGAEPTQVADRSVHVQGRLTYQRSDGVVVGADGVSAVLYDEDLLFDNALGSTVTDVNGNYSFSFTWNECWLCEEDPDLYVYFEASNDHVQVQSAGILETNYSWGTTTVENYSGTSLDLGTAQMATNRAALHILTDITRTWRWLNVKRGYNTQTTDVRWPDNDGAFYNTFFGEIHLDAGHEWHEDTHAHEYGHHWMEFYSSSQSTDYCNDICDSDGCGHCMWCEENGAVAWEEGWPNWFADVVTRSFGPDYGIASQFFRDQEWVQTCSGTLASSPITEGFLGSLARDIEDNSNEDDSGIASSFRDVLSLGTAQVFAVADLDEPTTPLDFIDKFKSRYPGMKEDLWETATNNGFDLDQVPPAAPTGLSVAISNTLLCQSGAYVWKLDWQRATDDFSGISGYSYQVGTSPVAPDFIEDVGDVTTKTLGCLSSGTYYVTMRTRDRSGNWSLHVTSAPFTVTGPIGAPMLDPAAVVVLGFSLLAFGAIAIRRGA